MTTAYLPVLLAVLWLLGACLVRCYCALEYASWLEEYYTT